MTSGVQATQPVNQPASGNSAPVRSRWNKCPFFRLLKKIWQAVKWLFEKCLDLFDPSPFSLSQRDIALLNAAKMSLIPKPAAKTPSSSDLNGVKVTPVQPPKPGETQTEPAKTEEPEKAQPAPLQPVMQAFRQTGMELLDIFIDITFEKKIAPHLPKVEEEMRNLQEYLYVGAGIAIDVGHKALKPLAKKLESFDFQKKISPDLKNLFNWVLKQPNPIDREVLQTALRQKLTEYLEQKVPPANDILDRVINPCLSWFLDSDHQKSLSESCGDLDKKQVEVIFIAAIHHLTSLKVKFYNESINKHLTGGNLAILTKKIIQENVRKIGDRALRRGIDLLENIPYQNTFNSFLKLLVEQTEGIITAETVRKRAIEAEKAAIERALIDGKERREAMKAQLELAKIAENTPTLNRPKDEEARQLRIEIKKLVDERGEAEWLDQIEDDARRETYRAHSEGRKAWMEQAEEDVSTGAYERSKDEEKRDEWLKEVGDAAAKRAYLQRQICHPQIETLHLVPEEDEDEDSSSESLETKGLLVRALEMVKVLLVPQANKEKNSEPQILEKMGEWVVDLLFPKVRVQDKDGLEYEVDGLLYLLDQFEYPKELSDLFQEGVYIYKEILTDDNQKLLVSSFKKMHTLFYSTIEENLLTYLKDHMKRGIALAFGNVFEKFIIPEKADELMMETVLPVFQSMLVESIGRQLIDKNKARYSNLFLTFHQTKEQAAKDVLIQTLYDELKPCLNTYAMEEAALKQCVEGVINEFYGTMEIFLESRGTVENEKLADLFRLALEKYSEKVYSNNRYYGDLLINLAFKMGDMNSTAESFSNWFEGELGKQFSASMYQAQSSPHLLVKKATETIQKRYLTKDAIEQLLYGNKVSDPEVIKQKLKEEIGKTSKIFYDFINFNLQNTQQEDLLKKNPVQWVWEAPKRLKNLVTKKLALWVVDSPDHLNEVITRVYQKLFGDRLRMQNLMVKIQEKIKDSMEDGAKALAAKGTHLPKITRAPSLLPEFILKAV